MNRSVALDQYRFWATKKLVGRIASYAGYVGCGCEGTTHSQRDEDCARADFERMARELKKRVVASGGRAGTLRESASRPPDSEKGK